MIFLFCVDTSASMNQKTTNGVRVIDAAKAGVEYFMLKRATDPSYAMDRFFLVTFEDGLAAIKAGWEEDTSDFLRELKSLQAFDMSDTGAALKKSFDLLNSNRVNSNVDTYGMGRQPWTLDPAVIIMLTDGGMMTDMGAPMMDFMMPGGSSYFGSELYREPFRWDQRLHALILKFTSNQSPLSNAQTKPPALMPMAQATGGSCVTVSSMRHMIHAMDAILNEHASRKPISITMQFEAMSVPNTPPSLPHPPAPLIQHVSVRGVGNWPLPEDYTVNSTTTTLPPRSALPRIMYRPISIVTPKPPMAQFPIDIYDLEPSPLVDWMNEHVAKGYALECSLVSGRDATAPLNVPPFGVVARFPDGVKLLVLPYNFQTLNGLLVHYQSRTIKWKADFDKYLAALPPYYVSPLKNALRNVPMQSAPILSGPPSHPYNLVPDTMVAMSKELPSDVVKWLDDIKERAKTGRAAFLTEITNNRKLQQLSMQSGSTASLSSMMSSSMSRAGTITRSHLLLQMEALRSRLHAAPNPQKMPQNSFQYSRSDEEEARHHVPIGEMGDFQAYLARKPAPLKTIEGPDSSTPGKPYFGNPFTKGDAGAFVDEVGVGSSLSPLPPSALSAAAARRKRKRKFGIGERADKLKQFVLSDASNSSTASASASTSTTASMSGTPTAIPSTPVDIPSSPVPAPPSLPHPPPAHSVTQSFIEQQRSRKERLHKWDATPSPAPVVFTAPILPEIASTQTLLKVAHANNALKLTVVSALNCQAAPDEQLLKKCWTELQGNADIKRKALQEWISLGLLFHIDLASLFSTFLAAH